MRCLGCGGKVSSETLSRVLSELDSKVDQAVVGLDVAEDAAVVEFPERKVTATVDFFAAPINDPDLMGRVAANHAASDCFAMGSKPTVALAMIQVPFGHPRGQERVLREVLVGANDVFRGYGAAIVGGHTIEGPSLQVGFAVLGQEVVAPLLKSSLKPGDQLVLTKPLGTGVLLAAHQRQMCRGPWYAELCEQMLRGNEYCLELAKRYSIHAATDVTGFGLAGHLLEMLDASRCNARLDLKAIPILPGAAELSRQGIQSSLAPDNRAAESRIRVSSPECDRARFDLLFDPQTSGGMLIGVASRDADDVLRELSQRGFGSAAVIGSVLARPKDSEAAIELAS
jgi:selenide,water dikinase